MHSLLFDHSFIKNVFSVKNKRVTLQIHTIILIHESVQTA